MCPRPPHGALWPARSRDAHNEGPLWRRWERQPAGRPRPATASSHRYDERSARASGALATLCCPLLSTHLEPPEGLTEGIAEHCCSLLMQRGAIGRARAHARAGARARRRARERRARAQAVFIRTGRRSRWARKRARARARAACMRALARASQAELGGIGTHPVHSPQAPTPGHLRADIRTCRAPKIRPSRQTRPGCAAPQMFERSSRFAAEVVPDFADPLEGARDRPPAALWLGR